MFKPEDEWNISFAGCGFSSIYYLGALSCILERVPHLVQGASKIGGASSGCLVAACLTVGIPIETCCAHVMSTALEARKHKLGVFHPGFSLLRVTRELMLRYLPQDAHLCASGKLCVSLTRASDGRNVLVSQFDSRDELIQVLMCSCFFPVYCGLTPPSYRGVHYLDGALSNNMPLFNQRNTITMSPFSGESDICPKEGTFCALEVYYGNLSIQVNGTNVNRILRSFIPPEPEMLAKICHNGYMDAVYFLRKHGLLEAESLSTVMLSCQSPPNAVCCKLENRQSEAQENNDYNNNNNKYNNNDHHHVLEHPNPARAQHQWLDPRLIQNLPISIKKVLCESCRQSCADAAAAGGFLPQVTEVFPVKLLCFLLLPCTLPLELILLLARSTHLDERKFVVLAGDIETVHDISRRQIQPDTGWSSRHSRGGQSGTSSGCGSA